MSHESQLGKGHNFWAGVVHRYIKKKYVAATALVVDDSFVSPTHGLALSWLAKLRHSFCAASWRLISVPPYLLSKHIHRLKACVELLGPRSTNPIKPQLRPPLSPESYLTNRSLFPLSQNSSACVVRQSRAKCVYRVLSLERKWRRYGRWLLI